MPAGRPRTIDVEDLIEKFEKYIDEHEQPFVIEFLLEYGISNCRFYELGRENEKLNHTIKKCNQKQELFIVKNAQTNKINSTFAIFQLKQKQFGWTDKQEIVQTVKSDLENLSVEELKAALFQLQKRTAIELQPVSVKDDEDNK